MMNELDQRRQPYIDRESLTSTLKTFSEVSESARERLQTEAADPLLRSQLVRMIADHEWWSLQLRYTTGASPQQLAEELSNVVGLYEEYADALNELPDSQYFPPFVLDNLIDVYVEYLNLLSVAVLLHREDLIPRLADLIAGTDYDGEDAIIEELLNFFLPNRPRLDQWIWERPYDKLLDVIDATSCNERSQAMSRYVKRWYVEMKGKAQFWGKHRKVTSTFSPYYGYWAMCAGAFTYLYDIDDGSYRDELVYPKDLVDFARSVPRRAVILNDGTQLLRVAGGLTCPKAGVWFCPAKLDSARYFDVGEIMPIFDASECGNTIWQWSSETRPREQPTSPPHADGGAKCRAS